MVLNTNVQPQRSYATIGITSKADEAPVEEADRAAIFNTDTSERSRKLFSHGLNPLKPVIIANTEFVPVATGGSPDSTGLKAQFGDNNILSVNNVAKLFEIHRQIRITMLNSSSTLLSQAKGYDVEAVLGVTEQYLKSHLSIIVQPTIKETINQVINAMSGQPASLASTGEGLGFDAVGVAGTVSTGVTSGADPLYNDHTRSQVREAFKTYADDPFFRTLVEYAVLEFIVYDAIRYLSGILSLKEKADRSWSIFEAGKHLSLYDLDRSGFSDSTKKMVDEIYSGIGATQPQLAGVSRVLEKYLGFSPSRGTGDLTCLLQTLINTATNVMLLPSFMGKSEENQNEQMSIMSKPRIAGNDTSMYDCLAHLQKMTTAGLIKGMKLGGDHYQKNGSTKARDKMFKAIKARDGYFDSKTVQDLEDKFPSGRLDGYADLLATIIFNDVSAAAMYKSSQSQMTKALLDLNGSQNTIQTPHDYFQTLLGPAFMSLDINQYADRKMETIEYDVKSGGRGAFTQKFKPKSTDTNTGASELYIPHESTGKAPGNLKYTTGTEFFFDRAIQRGDFNLNAFRRFAEEYTSFGEKFASDIYNMTNVDMVDSAFMKLCGKISSDLYTADSNSGIFSLICMLSLSDNTEGLVKLFRSAFYGSILTSRKGKSGGGVAKSRPKDVAPNTPDNIDSATRGTAAEEELSNRSVMRWSNQVLITNFLQGEAGVSNIVDKKRTEFRDSDGNERGGTKRGKSYKDREKRFDPIGSSPKKFNGGTGLDTDEPYQGGSFTIHRKSGQEYGTGNSGLTKEEHALEGGAYPADKKGPDTAMTYFRDNKYLSDAGVLTNAQRLRFNEQRPYDFHTDSNGHLDRIFFHAPYPKNINAQGANIKLSDHHRTFVLYAFLTYVLKKSVSASATSRDKKGSKNAKIIVTIGPSELSGVAKAFKDISDGELNRTFAREPKNAGEGVTFDNDRDTAFRSAYYRTTDVLKEVLGAIHQRQKKIATNAATPALHSNLLHTIYSRSRDYINEGDGTTRSKLALELLKSNKISVFDEALPLVSRESVSQMYESYISTFKSSKFGYTKEDNPNLKQMKIMMKLLSASGHGLRSDEKRGSKTICHVGVTNSMLNSLRIEASKEFDSARFERSPYVCVNLFKRNEIDSGIMVYPKTFLFDTSLRIVDCDKDDNELNHIKNYRDDWGFFNIIENLEFSRWSHLTMPGPDPFENIGSSFSLRKIRDSGIKEELKRGIGKNINSRDMVVNHAMDYAFKLYYKFAMGLDFNSHTFDLNPSSFIPGNITGGFLENISDLRNDYETFINQTKLLYPAANVNQELASELFRNIKTLAAHPVYSLTNKTQRTLGSKKFDRVFSMMISEKDFILYTPAFRRQFEDIYKNTPNFTFTSKISRPELKTHINHGGVGLDGSTLINSPENKYRTSCGEDFPEVFSIYATITMLPDLRKIGI